MGCGVHPLSIRPNAAEAFGTSQENFAIVFQENSKIDVTGFDDFQFAQNYPKGESHLWRLAALGHLLFCLFVSGNYLQQSGKKFRGTSISRIVVIGFFHYAFRIFQYGRLMFLEDILDSWAQWIIVLAITTTRTLILFLLQIPGCPKGYMGPGGYHDYGKLKNCTGGIVGYVDRLLLGEHTYHNTNNIIYGQTLPHDPEGVFILFFK